MIINNLLVNRSFGKAESAHALGVSQWQVFLAESGNSDDNNCNCNMKMKECQNYGYWPNKQMYDAQTNTSDVEEIRDSQRKWMNYLAFIVRIVHVCVEKQIAVSPRDAICGQLNEYLTLSTPTDSPTSSWYQLIFVFWKFKFAYFSHKYYNYSMFQDAPAV